jgi:cytochrome b561
MLLLVVAAYASMELREFYPKGSEIRAAMKTWHYMLGISILVLTVIRLAVYFAGPVPAALPGRKWQMASAKWMKVALYCFLLVMPVLGWLLVSAEGTPVLFFGLEVPPLTAENKGLAELVEELHEGGATIGYFLIGLHAAAALYHHYLVGDDTLRRMLPKRR